jgi:hypothetical protein
MIPGIQIVCIWILAVATGGQPAAGHTYALIVSGIGKDSNERLLKDRVVHELRTYLREKAGVEPQRLAVLVPKDSSVRNSAGISGRESIRKTLETFASVTGPTDRFIFYYVGQANAVVETQNRAPRLRLNLPGPDATQEDLAAWLGGIKAETKLIVLDCPCAAVAAKALAGPGRTILCAANENQVYGTRFGAHFVPALARAENDTNHDGKVSLLEAFTAAAREIEQWYRDKQLLPTETPCLEDSGDGVPSERPWRYEQDGADGRRAAQFFLAATRAD